MKKIFLPILLLSVLLSCKTTGDATVKSENKYLPVTEPVFTELVTLPDTILGLKKLDITEYENEIAGMGTSISYRQNYDVLTIYLYDMQEKVINSNLDDPIIIKAFNDALSEINQMVEQGIYTKFQVIGTGKRNFEKTGTEFLNGDCVFARNGVFAHSQILIKEYKNKILKIRLSLSSKATLQESEQYVEQIINEVVQKVLK